MNSKATTKIIQQRTIANKPTKEIKWNLTQNKMWHKKRWKKKKDVGDK